MDTQPWYIARPPLFNEAPIRSMAAKPSVRYPTWSTSTLPLDEAPIFDETPTTWMAAKHKDTTVWSALTLPFAEPPILDVTPVKSKAAKHKGRVGQIKLNYQKNMVHHIDKISPFLYW
jgi:hypothetical protein